MRFLPLNHEVYLLSYNQMIMYQIEPAKDFKIV